LNGDHKLDLVTVNAVSTVSLLLGKGDGTFAANVDYAAAVVAFDPYNGFNPASLALGDLNGDGQLDLVAASSAATTVSVLLGSCQ
jgi:hypothetical protein